jgi:CRP-like cAMP-binding protein
VEIPQLAIGIIEGLSFKGRCYSTMAQMSGTRSVTERLSHLRVHLSDAYGIRRDDGILISDAFTHIELANMVGATRQWVTISLKKMEQRGVLSRGNATITVLRRDMLADMRD